MSRRTEKTRHGQLASADWQDVPGQKRDSCAAAKCQQSQQKSAINICHATFPCFFKQAFNKGLVVI